MKKKPSKFTSTEERPKFGPCSVKQRMILLDYSTDILLCGGGAGKQHCPR